MQSRFNDMRLHESKSNVVHNQTEPVIILGHARSGTSILGQLLRKYFQISFGPESQFLIRFQKILPAYGDLAQETSLSKLLHDVLQERCFQRWHNKFGYDLDEKEIFPFIKESSFKGVVYAIFDYLAFCGGMVRWGDKTPIYSWHLDVIKVLFPKSKYIHIVRDGRDVALSSFNIHFGAKNIYKVAKGWSEQIEKVQEFSNTIPDNQFLEMRYEDLMRNPEVELSRLISFLNIKDSDGYLQKRIKDNIRQDLKENNFNKWKNQMLQKDIFLFELISKKWLEWYDYQIVHALNAPQKLPRMKKIYWEVQNIFYKLIDREYLQDNLYKLKLRLQYMVRK